MATSTSTQDHCYSQNSVFTYRAQEQHYRSMMLAMGEMRKENRYVDVQIELDDNCIIPAHKLVLSAYSPYFEGLLSPNMQEGSQAGPIKIHSVDKTSMLAIIDFAYTSEIDITNDNVQSLLETANYLSVLPLVEACGNFLKSEMDPMNCVQILTIADALSLRDLLDFAKAYALNNFNEVFTGEDFFNMSYELFSMILQQEAIVFKTDNVVAPSSVQEFNVLRALLSYVTNARNSNLSKEQIRDLFQFVRFGVITPHNLLETHAQYQKFLNRHRELLPLFNFHVQRDRIDMLFPEDVTSQMAVQRKYPRLCRYWESQVLAGSGNVRPVIDKFCHCHASNEIEDTDFVNGMDLTFRHWDTRTVLAGIKVYYSNSVTFEHGELNLPDRHSFRLQPNERITKVDARSGWMIDNLIFVTNLGRNIGPFGGPGGGHHLIAPPTDWCPSLARIGGYVVHTQGALGITCLRFYFHVYQLTDDCPDPENRPPSGRRSLPHARSSHN